MGKHCVGQTTGNSFLPKETKAFSEGLYYRAGGTAANRPITDNPQDGEAAAAWSNGWSVAQAAAPGAIDPNDAPCVAVPAGNVSA